MDLPTAHCQATSTSIRTPLPQRLRIPRITRRTSLQFPTSPGRTPRILCHTITNLRVAMPRRLPPTTPPRQIVWHRNHTTPRLMPLRPALSDTQPMPASTTIPRATLQAALLKFHQVMLHRQLVCRRDSRSLLRPRPCLLVTSRFRAHCLDPPTHSHRHPRMSSHITQDSMDPTPPTVEVPGSVRTQSHRNLPTL